MPAIVHTHPFHFLPFKWWGAQDWQAHVTVVQCAIRFTSRSIICTRVFCRHTKEVQCGIVPPLHTYVRSYVWYRTVTVTCCVRFFGYACLSYVQFLYRTRGRLRMLKQLICHVDIVQYVLNNTSLDNTNCGLPLQPTMCTHSKLSPPYRHWWVH